jgi:hypothetical protein
MEDEKNSSQLVAVLDIGNLSVVWLGRQTCKRVVKPVLETKGCGH